MIYIQNLNVVLVERLWRVADDAKRHVDGLLDCEYEISHAQIVVLRALVQRTCRGTLSEIAKLLGCTNENAGRLVARLVGREHLQRVRNGDARMKEVVATERGNDFLRGVELQIQRDAMTALEPLDTREKEQLFALLSRIEDRQTTERKHPGGHFLSSTQSRSQA